MVDELIRMKHTAPTSQGFSTLEIVIAMALLAMTLSGVVIVSFGNQSMLLGSQTNGEAMKKAQELLERSQALARKDFNLVNPISSTTDDIYEKSLEVRSPSSTDFFTKQIAARVSWVDDHRTTQQVRLTALVANFENAIGGDTCSSVLSGDWKNPLVGFSGTIGALSGGTPSDYRTTDVDAYKQYLYVVSNLNTFNRETFFIFDIQNPLAPTLKAKLDNDPSVNAGLSGVAVAEHTSDGKLYAYVASGSSFSKGQMQVIDVTQPTAPSVAKLYKIATSTVHQGASGQGLGNTVYYKNGYVYLGLTKTGSTDPEFNIIDVHNPLDPVYVGGYAVGNGVNDIVVRGRYAYVASPNAQELIILDISNPASPTLAGGFNATDGTGNGESFAFAGDTLYLGRVNAGNELSILNNQYPTSTTRLSSYDIGSAVGESIYGLVVRDYLLFALTNGKMHILNVSSSTLPVLWPALPLTLPGAGTSGGSSLDCEGNTLYVGTNINGGIYVITPS